MWAKNVLMGLLVAAAPVAASANELILSQESAKSGGASAFALDYQSDGAAVALQIRLSVPGASEKNVNLSKCLSELPKSHEGTCTMTKSGEVLLVIYSGTNAALPAGLVPIGSIGVRNIGKSGRVAVTELLVSDKNAQPIKATSSAQ